MIVTVWRHGEAGPAATDRQRELTDDGFDDIGFGCRQFHAALEARLIAAPDLFLHSPWLRTEQTAQILASAFTHAPARELAALRPGGDVTAVALELAALEGTASASAHVVLVSHQPLVSQLLDYLLGVPCGVPSLSPGSLATLELPVVARACGVLRFWAAPPEYQAGT